MSLPKDFAFTDYQPYDFANRRHIGPSPKEMEAMLKVIGYDSLDALIDDTVPKSIRLPIRTAGANSATTPSRNPTRTRACA